MKTLGSPAFLRFTSAYRSRAQPSSHRKLPIIRLPGGGQCPLVRDSEPIRLFEIPTSPSLYMLITIIIPINYNNLEHKECNKK